MAVTLVNRRHTAREYSKLWPYRTAFYFMTRGCKHPARLFLVVYHENCIWRAAAMGVPGRPNCTQLGRELHGELTAERGGVDNAEGVAAGVLAATWLGLGLWLWLGLWLGLVS